LKAYLDLTMRRSFFIVHNPAAGPAARSQYSKTLALLTEAGARVETVDTRRHGEGMRAASRAAQSGLFDAIIAAGGDGTVHDAAEAIVGDEIPLGIIPMGTANVFAREAGLPFSPRAVADVLLAGAKRAIPVGQVNGRAFLFVVGVGFDAEAVRRFEIAGNRKLGQAGFVTPVLGAILSYSGGPLLVTTNSGKSEAGWIIVTRARRYAAGLLLAPEAGVTETHFHVIRFAGLRPWDRVRQLSALACGFTGRGSGITIESAEWVRVEGNAQTPVQVDGEALGQLPANVELHPKRLTILVP
jgi:diacylglycerol kinase (ATP)